MGTMRNTGSPSGDCSMDQLATRERQAGPFGMAERLVVPMKPNSNDGKPSRQLKFSQSRTLMGSAHQVKFEWNAVPHPGETVLEYLDFNGWSQRDLARRTDLTPKTISEICNGKGPITPPTALAFEKVFQRPAHFWLNLQRQFDEAEARRHELAKTSQWKKWAATFPLKEMKRLKFFFAEGPTDAAMLLNFFGVSSPDSWNAVWKASAVAYRQTRKFKT